MTTVALDKTSIYAQEADTIFGAEATAELIREKMTGEGYIKKKYILLQCRLPTTLPSVMSVSAAQVNLVTTDTNATGVAQLRKLPWGFYKYQTCWNYIHKGEERPWRDGPFKGLLDPGDLYWKGSLTNDATQILTGFQLLRDYIEAAGPDGYVSLILISHTSYSYKLIDSADLVFTYDDGTTPVIDSFSPEEMDLGETPTMIIKGSGFYGSLTNVQLVGTSTYSLSSATIVDETTITGDVPAGVAVDEYTVRVNISGKSAADSADYFVVSDVAPTITSVESDFGGFDFVPNFYKPKLTLRGTNLGSPTTIKLIGQEGQGWYSLTNVTGVSSSEIKGLLPDPPIPPGRYRAQAVVSAGKVYSKLFQVSLGPGGI